MKRKKILRIFLVALAACSFLFMASAWLLFSDGSPVVRSSALSTCYEWARLDQIPDTAEDVSVKSVGSMFTREFRISFRAPVSDVNSWLATSPGTKEAIPELLDDGTRVYNIKPGGGAQFAKVSVSKEGTKVRIHTYWS